MCWYCVSFWCLYCRVQSTLDQPCFLEAEVALAGDDEVIEDAEAEDAAGFGQPVVGAEVGVAGVEVAGGVVVSEDNGGRPADDLTGVNLFRHPGEGWLERAGCDSCLPRPELPQSSVLHQLIERLEREYLATGCKDHLLHIFAPHAKAATSDTCDDFVSRTSCRASR